MRRLAPFAPLLLAVAAAPVHRLPAQEGASRFTAEQVLAFPFPTSVTAAARGARVAWTFNEQGRRNVWVAEGPAFAARRLTPYDRDDGQELTSVGLSPDGRWVVYVRGGEHGSNWDDQLPVNPALDPAMPRMQVISVPFDGGAPRVLGEGDGAVISPSGDRVAFARGGQVWVAPIDGSAPARQLFAVRGGATDPRWSPDGSRLAFVSSRGTHAFIGIYANDSTPIRFLAPSTSRDGSPRWSPDGRRVAFVRRPGGGGAPDSVLARRHNPWSIWTADAATGGDARRVYEAPRTLRGSAPSTHGGTNLHWAARGRIVFLSYADGWPHLYSIPEAGGTPLLLTPGAHMAEHVSLSPDGTYLVYAGNTGPARDDIDRRHVVRVSVDRADAQVLTPGTGLEWSPVVTGDGATIVHIAATAQRPPLPAVMPAAGGAARTLAADRVPADFPSGALVVPRQVVYRAPDGTPVHAQLFERPGGGSKPAIVYVHGGPPRQMLLGWHYGDYYANAYATNQYLASLGYVVLAVNYRLGIGYGWDFHNPPRAGRSGAAEYQDVKAGGEYLRGLPQVDDSRIGIYGGSYGGYLTALGLARDSRLFAAGVDIHGVHDFTADRVAGMLAPRYETPADTRHALDVMWRASPVSSIATWRSPVLLIHGDDDRNVRFAQTADLARRLESAGVRFEELVIPDETHHWMRHESLVRVTRATAEFFDRTIGRRATQASSP